MTSKNTKHVPDIRIGTLVDAGMKSPEYIRQILPHGFESFGLTFPHTTQDINWEKLAAELRAVLAESGAVISSLAVFGNPLESDEKAKETIKAWEAVIDHAQLFACDVVAGFSGGLRNRPVAESIPRFKEVWTPLAMRAQDKGLRIAFENCAWPENIAHNPVAWEMMFNAVPFDNLGLEWEPCHQLIDLIDPMPQLREWVNKIFHVHGKDATVYWDRVRKYGAFVSIPEEAARKFGSQGTKPFAYHRTPGFGDSDWTAIISDLRLGGFKGSIDIEGWHDPVMKGELEMSGQVAALKYLKHCRADFIAKPMV